MVSSLSGKQITNLDKADLSASERFWPMFEHTMKRVFLGIERVRR